MSSSSSSPILGPFDPILRYCSGFHGSKVNKDWTKISDGTHHNKYICPFCKYVRKYKGPCQLLSSQDIGRFTVCESIAKDSSYTVFSRDGTFTVQILTKDKKSPFYINAPMDTIVTRANTMTGAGVFLLPTQAEYGIKISFARGDDHMDRDMYFDIKSITFGDDKKVEINNGKTIYYLTETTVSGMKTGSKESFKFYSPSDYELKELPNDVPDHLSQHNLITIKLQKHKRIRKQEPQSWRRSDKFNKEDDFMLTLSRKRGGGNLFDQTFSAGESRFESRSVANSSPILPPATGSVSAAGFGNSNDPYLNVSTGTTISGNSYVPEVSTVETTDKYEPIGPEVTFRIQLGCFQDDKVKEVYNLRTKVAGMNYIKQQALWTEGLLMKQQEVLTDQENKLIKITKELGKWNLIKKVYFQQNETIIQRIPQSLQCIIDGDDNVVDQQQNEAVIQMVSEYEKQQQQSKLIQFLSKEELVTRLNIA